MHFMNSLKAIVSGVIFIIAVTLLMQLAYILIAVGYNHMAQDYPSLNGISGVIKYLILIPTIMAIMFAGGYITAAITENKVMLNCFMAGTLSIGVMMWQALSNWDVTPSGIIVILLMLVSTIGGGYYQKKTERTSS